MLQPGTEAPDFTVPDQDGNPVTLSTTARPLGAAVVVPDGDTPG